MALSPPEISLIKSLREEATEVKECFTKFSFQAIGLGVAVVGYMAVHSENLLANATGAGAVISLMLATAHIGAHKYHTANRNHGFELYLRHAAQCRSSLSESEWPDWSKPIGWEEAMRAWRVVQATFFEKLYCPRPYPNWLRGKVRIDTRKKWFEPDELVKENATYHAGSYLGTVQLFLFLLSIIALVPLISQTVETRRKSFGWETQLVLLGALFFFILYRWIWNAARRSVLERGLLCIPSCAIMWQAVVAAHHRALIHAKGDAFKTEYWEGLARLTGQLCEDPFAIRNWIEGNTASDRGIQQIA